MGQITDLTGYTWVGNNAMEWPGYKTYNINTEFIYVGGEYGGVSTFTFSREADRDLPIIELSRFNLGLGYYATGSKGSSVMSVTVDSTTGASDVITFTGGADITNSEFIAWLETNGTLTAPVVPPIVEDNGNWKVTSGEEDILLHTANTYLDKDILIMARPKLPSAESAEF